MLLREHWWEASDRAAAVRELQRNLLDQSRTRIDACAAWRLAYLGRCQGTEPWIDQDKRSSYYMLAHELGNLVNALIARITRTTPRPMYLTDAGSYDERQKAKKMSRWVAAGMATAGAEPRLRRGMRDGMIYSLPGVVKVTPIVAGAEEKTALPGLDRVLPWELYVDQLEARYGEPRTWVQCRAVDRGVLLALFPEHASAIERETAIATGDTSVPNPEGLDFRRADCLLMTEAWHLPSGPKEKDGRRAVTLGSTLVADEPWTRTRTPFALIRWYDGEDGWSGAGVVESGYAWQAMLDRRHREIERAMDLVGRPIVLSPNDAKVSDGDLLSNQIARVVNYQGVTPPQVATPAPMHPQVLDWTLKCREMPYMQAGLSPLAATMTVPAGLESGRALRVHEDIQDARHLEPGKAWEGFALDVARLFVEEIEAAAKVRGAGNIIVRVGQRRSGWRKLTWADVKLDSDAYTVEVLPISALASTPAARMEQVDEWVERGWIDTEEAMDLLDMPDFDDAMLRRLSDRQIAFRQVGRILTGEGAAPEVIPGMTDAYGNVIVPDLPLQNLEVALDVARRSYLVASDEDCPPERLEMLREYMMQTVLWLKKAAAATVPIPGAGPAPATVEQLPLAQGGAAPPMAPEEMVA